MNNEYFASINDVSRELGVPAHTLRYWEKQFPTVVRPTTGAGGRRYYRAETVARLKSIQELLYDRGMTIAGVKKMIHNGEFLSDNHARHDDVVNSASPRSIRDDDMGLDAFPDVFGQTNHILHQKINTENLNFVIGLLTQARELLQ